MRDVERQVCMLGKCSKCPVQDGVRSFLDVLEDECEDEMNMGDSIAYKQ